MAYVVARPNGRWEIRESVATGAGPRARTLASFRVLTPEVIERASKGARTAFDRHAVLRSAGRAGARLQPERTDALAASLARDLARGAEVRPGLRRLLVDGLAATSRPMPASVDPSVGEWIAATLEERGTALVDLLGLADRLPKPRRRGLDFPGLSAERLRR